MKTYAQKVKEAREILDISQRQLAEQIGVSQRTITMYETGASLPRGTTVRKLAKALNVSVEYLMNDDIDDPHYGLDKETLVEQARERYGNRAAREAAELLEKNQALFAGGELDQEAKDAFFEALMKAYLTCKEEARKTYGRKKK